MKNKTLVAAMLMAADWADPKGGGIDNPRAISYATSLCTDCGDDPEAEVSINVNDISEPIIETQERKRRGDGLPFDITS